jgi:hypothetical protein
MAGNLHIAISTRTTPFARSAAQCAMAAPPGPSVVKSGSENPAMFVVCSQQGKIARVKSAIAISRVERRGAQRGPARSVVETFDSDGPD